tara:strand:+ start:341 stop:475 length:135 start_codon:yes stop_codon:yes gene_type:complete
MAVKQFEKGQKLTDIAGGFGAFYGISAKTHLFSSAPKKDKNTGC